MFNMQSWEGFEKEVVHQKNPNNSKMSNYTVNHLYPKSDEIHIILGSHPPLFINSRITLDVEQKAPKRAKS